MFLRRFLMRIYRRMKQIGKKKRRLILTKLYDNFLQKNDQFHKEHDKKKTDTFRLELN